MIAAGLLCAAAVAALWPREGSAREPNAPPRAETAGNAGAAPASAHSSSPSPTGPPASALANVEAPDEGTIALTPGPEAVVERLDAETIRLDGRFTVRGSGTERDPYRITWDLLTSAAESISAEEKRWVLPGRLAALQGAWVQISGYWAPPLQQFQTREIMVMLNRWDGCCIGRPPTPFDCMDVTLTAPLTISGLHLFRYGTVCGRLRIAPFAAGPYLLGLYQLEDAVLESS